MLFFIFFSALSILSVVAHAAEHGETECKQECSKCSDIINLFHTLVQQFEDMKANLTVDTPGECFFRLAKLAEETKISIAKITSDLDDVRGKLSVQIPDKLAKQTEETRQSMATITGDLEQVNVRITEQAADIAEIKKSISGFSCETNLRKIEEYVDDVANSTRYISESLQSHNQYLRLHDERLQNFTANEKCSSGSGGFAPRDCSDVRKMGFIVNGIYSIYPSTTGLENNTHVNVYCDFDTPGGYWLVFQRRKDGSVDFERNWKNYTDGFGNPNQEFWLGNQILHQLTKNRNYKLRIDMEDFENQKRFAEYSSFSIGTGADHYRLKIGTYSGNAGDAMKQQNNNRFSTFDVDLATDTYGNGCANLYHGAWWYYDFGCHQCNLNGRYFGGTHSTYADGINWGPWHGFYYSLKATEMKIAPLG